MHYVIMTDSGISGSETPGEYPPYDLGVKEDVFVKNSSDQIFIGKVRKCFSWLFKDFIWTTLWNWWFELTSLMGFIWLNWYE